MMPIRATVFLPTWNFLVRAWKSWRPLRRRSSLTGRHIESFEPRRMLSAFVVNSPRDSHDANPGDGIAVDADGQTTLRAAIEEANALVGADTIFLPNGELEIGREIVESILVSDAVSLVGTGTSATALDGSGLDQIFELAGSGQVTLTNVVTRDAHDLAASLQPLLLTTNTRQADLVMAFLSPPVSPPLVATLVPNGLSPIVGVTDAVVVVDETPVSPVERIAKVESSTDPSAKPDGSATEPSEAPVPSPDSAIDDIIRALFERESPAGVQPAGNEKQEPPMKVKQALPDQTRPLEPAEMGAFDSQLHDEDFWVDFSDSSLVETDQAMASVLQSWANDPDGMPEFASSSHKTQTLATRTSAGHRVGTMVGMVLAGVVVNSWPSSPRWMRDSFRVRTWQRRLSALRRRAR